MATAWFGVSDKAGTGMCQKGSVFVFLGIGSQKPCPGGFNDSSIQNLLPQTDVQLLIDHIWY